MYQCLDKFNIVNLERAVLSHSVLPHSATPWTVACPAPLSVGTLPGKNTGVGCHALLQGSQPRIEPRSAALQVHSLSSELPRKPRNTGVGSLSLLQWNFLTQEQNWVLLHCRQVLYQLSYPVVYLNSLYSVTEMETLTLKKKLPTQTTDTTALIIVSIMKSSKYIWKK